MEPDVIAQLKKNTEVLRDLLKEIPAKEFLWKQSDDKWCLLEIVCHLRDEETQDFRLRTKSVLEDPSKPLPPIDPPAWVTDRKYMEQDYDRTLHDFIEERLNSIAWLESLRDPQWENTYEHPKLGPLTARRLLFNWFAHDLLHMRQIIRLKFDYLAAHGDENLEYAGKW